MNRFELHHRNSISFSYSCFDRMIFNGYIRSFQHSACGGSIYWFLRNHRQLPSLGHAAFRKISSDYHQVVQEYSTTTGVDIVVPEKGIRREELVAPYFQQLGNREGVAVILKAREPERIAWYFSKKGQTEVVRRCVDLYYFYLNDANAGRMFLRVCPYFPFNISVWLNGHNWLACQLQKEGIPFEKRDNLFVACAQPQRLQELSDAFAPGDVVRPVEAWLTRLLPYFTDAERQQGYRHQLYMSQMEYCHNLIFHKKAAADRLFDRLMDGNRSIGHPDKLAIIFGRTQFRPDTRTGQTTLKVTEQRMPVISSSYKTTGVKQYVRDGVGMRTESSSHQLKDLSIAKNINNLAKVRDVMDQANERYLTVQQDILASYVDRGQLQELLKPSVSPTGRRVPGMHVDDPRLLAVLQAILCFAYLVGKGCFRVKDLLMDVQKALDNPEYTMNQLRYDLSKLRGKGLVSRLPRTQSYQIGAEGYRIGAYYLKLYQKLYAPLTAAIRDPVPTDNAVLTSRQTKLDRLYVAVDKALHNLADHLGMAA
jgi:hypothetical protein